MHKMNNIFPLPTSILPMKKSSFQTSTNRQAPSYLLDPSRKLPFVHSQNLNHPKLEQPTKEFFYSIINKPQLTNTPILQAFKLLDPRCRNKLQQFCISQFDNLPLFLLYELGWELGLQKLTETCSLQLINENFEQLNYSKFDLIKCSLFTFQKILSQQSSLAKSLEIQGLKPSNLKSVIDDYCLMRDVDPKDKNSLYNQFVLSKQFFIPAPCQVRRSMIETTKTKMEFQSSLKLENALQVLTTPLQADCGVEITPKQKTRADPQNIGLDESIRMTKLQIEEQTRKYALLFSQILEARQKYSETSSDRFLKKSFERLEKALQKMQIQIKIQNQKLEKIRKSACDIKGRENKIDFIYNF